MIDEKKAFAAEQWIYDNIDNIAQSRSDKVKAEEMLRVVKSEIILTTEGSVAQREATAFASPEYRKALDAYAEAVRVESQFYTKLKAAETRIDMFRSINANLRRN
jgi:hypothetical protein